MLVIEIPDNPNCDRVDTRVFHDLEPPTPVSQIQLERQAGHPQWYELTGWTLAGSPCPAVAQKVDDSGEGVAFLVYGGDAGLRFRPAGRPGPWRLDDSDQWGEPFLLTTQIASIKYGKPS